ncbi:hypothetical protein [Kitasatospora sp. NPDC086791]|uniref:hypothetical protein n=1 Tax=Kitasatospora sp. NPDC086791 TaxID=3155178 RepID=UPI00342B266D
MNARIEDARPPGRPRASGAVTRALARCLLVVVGLAAVVVGFGWFLDTFRSVDAYRTAPVCGTPAAAPGTPCVRRETGKVTARNIDSGGDSNSYLLTVARETGPAHTFNVGQAFYDEAGIGTDVDLKVWNGRAVEVSWHGHRAAPRDIPFRTSLKLSLLIGAGSAVTVYGLAWPRGGGRAVPPLAAVPITLSSFIGGFVLFAAQWPLVITLGVPALGWLFLIAVSTALAIGF